MEKIILLRFGEIYLKGKNRFSFEKQLLDNVKYALKGLTFTLTRMHGRYVIENVREEDLFEVEMRIRKVFGLVSYSVALKMPTDLDLLKKECLAFLPSGGSFRFTVNRADKKYSLFSYVVINYLKDNRDVNAIKLGDNVKNPVDDLARKQFKKNQNVYAVQGKDGDFTINPSM